jgi:FkbM family methyltransferase
MNRIKRHLRGFGNLSLPERPRVFLEIFARKVFGMKPSPSFSAKSIFNMLMERSQLVEKEGALNRISLRGPYFPWAAQFYIRRNTTDIIIFQEILFRQGYRYLQELAGRLGLDVRYIIDAGANIGSATVYLKSVFPQAHIVSIEPESGNFSVLQKNIAVNKFRDVTPLKAGLWNRKCQLQVREGFRGGVEKELSFYVEEVEGPAGDDTLLGVSVTSVMEEFHFPRVDVLKIDIEGAERYIFDSLEATEETLKNVKILAIEVHEEVMDKWLLVDRLERLGFRQISFGEILYAYRS